MSGLRAATESHAAEGYDVADMPYVVGIVIDPESGERVRGLLERMPVWLAEMSTNRAAAERYWRE